MRDEVLQRIKTAKLRRLEVLEEQIAMIGEAYAEPQQLTERDDLKKQLGLAEAILSSGLDDETRKIFRRYDQADLNIAVLSNVVQRVTGLEERYAFDQVRRRWREVLSNAWMIGSSLAFVFIVATLVYLIGRLP